jgi:hypothetical protein
MLAEKRKKGESKRDQLPLEKTARCFGQTEAEERSMKPLAKFKDKGRKRGGRCTSSGGRSACSLLQLACGLPAAAREGAC